MGGEGFGWGYEVRRSTVMKSNVGGSVIIKYTGMVLFMTAKELEIWDTTV